jgi:hypothetical protein
MSNVEHPLFISSVPQFTQIAILSFKGRTSRPCFSAKLTRHLPTQVSDALLWLLLPQFLCQNSLHYLLRIEATQHLTADHHGWHRFHAHLARRML